MVETAKPPVLAARGGAWFCHQGLELHLGVEEAFQPARKAHPGIMVDGLDDWAERLTSSGAKVDWDDNFPGRRREQIHPEERTT